MDQAIAEERHPVGHVAGEADLVGDQDHGHAFLGEQAHGVQHLADQLRVERRGGFVEQHVVRRHRQRPGDRHALLLAAGKALGEDLELVAETDVGELLQRHRLGFGAALAEHLARREHDVFQHGQVGEGVPLLEDDADLPPQAVEVGTAGMHVDAVDADAAALDRLQAVDAHQQGRLAGTGAADDRQHLALVHPQVDTLDHLELAVGLVHVADLDHCCHLRSSRAPSRATTQLMR